MNSFCGCTVKTIANPKCIQWCSVTNAKNLQSKSCGLLYRHMNLWYVAALLARKIASHTLTSLRLLHCQHARPAIWRHQLPERQAYEKERQCISEAITNNTNNDDVFAWGKLNKTATGIASSHAATLWTQNTLTPLAEHYTDMTGREGGKYSSEGDTSNKGRNWRRGINPNRN